MFERGCRGIGSLKLGLQSVDLGPYLRDVDLLNVAQLVLQIGDVGILRCGFVGENVLIVGDAWYAASECR